MTTRAINLYVREEADLYSPFDLDRQVLSDDVISYLSARYQERSLGDRMVVRLISEKPLDRDRAEAAFRAYVEGLRDSLSRERKRNRVKQLWMFSVGAAFIALGLYAASSLPALTGEIISTIGAFAMWEAASIWIVQNPANRLARRRVDLFSDTELLFERAETTGETGPRNP